MDHLLTRVEQHPAGEDGSRTNSRDPSIGQQTLISSSSKCVCVCVCRSSSHGEMLPI